jgi:hypothetical protein
MAAVLRRSRESRGGDTSSYPYRGGNTDGGGIGGMDMPVANNTAARAFNGERKELVDDGGS